MAVLAARRGAAAAPARQSCGAGGRRDRRRGVARAGGRPGGSGPDAVRRSGPPGGDRLRRWPHGGVERRAATRAAGARDVRRLASDDRAAAWAAASPRPLRTPDPAAARIRPRRRTAGRVQADGPGPDGPWRRCASATGCRPRCSSPGGGRPAPSLASWRRGSPPAWRGCWWPAPRWRRWRSSGRRTPGSAISRAPCAASATAIAPPAPRPAAVTRCRPWRPRSTAWPMKPAPANPPSSRPIGPGASCWPTCRTSCARR